MLHQHLRSLIEQIDDLEQLKEQEDADIITKMKDILANSIAANSQDIYPTLLKYLRKQEFNRERLQQKIDNAPAGNDVFDQIMPYLENNDAAKILFAYNKDKHWVTCEIRIYKEKEKYDLILTTHNPFGGSCIGGIEKDLTEKDAALLQQSISERIKDFEKQREINFSYIDSPYPFKRQQDTSSCGVIVVEEIIQRISGDIKEAAYEKGCQQAREHQYQLMSNYVRDQNLLTDLKQFLINTEIPTSLRVQHETDMQKAMRLLGIDSKRLEQFSTAAKREKYIHDKHLISELRSSAICRAYGFNEKKTLAELGKMHQLLSSSVVEGRTDKLAEAPMATALQDFEARSVYKAKNRHASIIELEKKRKGVEPGFVGILHEDLADFIQNKYPENDKRLDYFNEICGGDLKNLHRLNSQALPTYLIKMDYTLSANGKKAYPNKENLKKISSIASAYKTSPFLGALLTAGYQLYKTGTPCEINCMVVREALANDIARASKMGVQDQTIYEATYQDNQLKLMLKGKWLKGAKNLGPLAGGPAGSHYNYLVKPIAISQEGIQFLADDTIDLAKHYATVLIQGDYDAIGSGGDN